MLSKILLEMICLSFSHVPLMAGVAQCQGTSRQWKSGDLVLVLTLLLVGAGRSPSCGFNMDSGSEWARLGDREGGEGEKVIASSSSSQRSEVNKDKMSWLGL